MTQHERNLIIEALRLMAQDEQDLAVAAELRELADRVEEGEEL